MIGRRELVGAIATFGVCGFARAQIARSYITIVRETNISTVLSLNDCIKGRLFFGDRFFNNPSFTAVDGFEFCDTLELPWRNDINEISACKSGVYEGKIRTDGKLKWRIELQGTQPRKNIQIHIGNSPKDIVGCILPGRWSSTKSCWVQASSATLLTLKAMLGDNQNPISIKIV